MIFWVINAILIHGLIYYWHTIITKNSQDLLMLRHLAILLWYFLLIEIAYNCFLIRYNGKVVGTEINLYKIRIITYGFIIFYSLLAYLLTIANPDQIIKN